MLLPFIFFLLCQSTTSDKNNIQLNRKFSGLYYDLNLILGEYGRRIPYLDAQSEHVCSQNKECQEVYENSMCDRFFIRRNNEEIQYNGTYCVRKPVFENNIGLVADLTGVGPRRCSNYRFCGKDEMCLVLNSRNFDDGFCVKLKVCSRNRDASREYSSVVPGHRWDCFDFSVAKPFSLLYLENGTEHRSRSVHTCCSEPTGGKCIYGNATFPLKSCLEHSDCFTKHHHPTEWCDETTKICCSDQSDDKSIKCSDGSTYPFLEPKCNFYNKDVSSSGNCSTNADATCLHGHCCPSVEVSNRRSENVDETKKVFTYKITYETSIPCNPNLPLRRISWAFCDGLTRKIVVLSNEKYEELKASNGSDCTNNNGCVGVGSVCVWGYGRKTGVCMQNPVSVLSFHPILSYTLFGFSIAFIIIFSILTTVFQRITKK